MHVRFYLYCYWLIYTLVISYMYILELVNQVLLENTFELHASSARITFLEILVRGSYYLRLKIQDIF